MKAYSINTTKMSVVLSNYLVLFEVPAFYLFILAAWKQIRVPVAHHEPSDGVDMAGERNLEFSVVEIPKLDCPIVWSSHEELVERVNCYRSYPSCMPRNHTLQFPGRLPFHCYFFLSSDSNILRIMTDGLHERLAFVFLGGLDFFDLRFLQFFFRGDIVKPQILTDILPLGLGSDNSRQRTILSVLF